MIGNDIVDLKLASEQSNWRRKNFLAKVFTLGERKIFEASEDMDLTIWLLWSMKEAAYKAHQRKKSLPRSLNWTAQECRSLKVREKKASGIVRIQEEKYFSFSIFTPDYIHTIAVHQKETRFHQYVSRKPLLQTKQLFKQEISQLLQTRKAEIQLRKTETGIPIIYLENKISPMAFSFSDHGRFSGFCVSLRDS